MEVFERWRSWADAEELLRGLVQREDLRTLRAAFAFAAAFHSDQRRAGGAPYTEHLLRTTEILVEGAGILDRDTLVTALLQDVVEETPVTFGTLTERFGPEVANLVGWVTEQPPAPDEREATARRRYLVRLQSAPSEAILVKLADRLSSVQHLDDEPDEARQRSCYLETVTWIVPLTAAHPWFATQYAAWQQQFAHLAPMPRKARPDELGLGRT